jgi:hypothetical protein
MATYTLGKDYTVEGLTGASDLTWTQAGERLDVTTREGTKPYKKTVAGLVKHTVDCSVLAQDSTKFEIGETVSLVLNDQERTCIVVQANRSEPKDGVVTYSLQLTPGSSPANTCPV